MGLNVFGDIMEGIGSWQASEQQKKQAQAAMDLQREIYGQARADQMPWLQAGQTSLADLLRMTQGGYDSSQMAQDPGFQFRMSEGQKALERSAAARGGLNSGGFMKGLARYSQGVASDEFGNRYNRLAQLAGLGQGSAQNLGARGGQYASDMSNLYGAYGNAQAAGTKGMSGAAANLGGTGSDIAMLMAGAPGGFSGLMGGGVGMGGNIPTQQGMAPGRAQFDYRPAGFNSIYGGG